MAVPKKKKKTIPGQEKKYTFTFTVPEIIGLCAGAVTALCAFFVLGILLGRGYQPEKAVPEIAMMLPSQATNSSGEVKGGVLKPEELDYIDQLKKKPEPAVTPEPKKAEVAAKPEKKAEPVAEKKEPVKTEKAPAQVAETKQDPAPNPEPEPAVEIDNPAENTQPVYNYVYQAASFGSDSKAQEFNSKLASEGLNSYVQAGKGGTRTWYRVYVRHTGSPDSTNTMKAVLAKYGIKKPLLKSKQAAE